MNKELMINVLNQLGYEWDGEISGLDQECIDELKNVCEHGASGGFGQFVYYRDTVKFFTDNKKAILEKIANDAESIGMSKFEFLSGFNAFKNDNWEDEIGNALYGEIGDNEYTVPNVLAWYALEETASYLIQTIDEL